MLYVAVRTQPPGGPVRAVRLAADRARRRAGHDQDDDRGGARGRGPGGPRVLVAGHGAAGPAGSGHRQRWPSAMPPATSSRSRYDYGSDELGEVARALDGSAQELGRRLEELARDRARSDATLSGMVEGVLVVDRQGHVQLVNQAARAMLRVEGEVQRPPLSGHRPPSGHRGAGSAGLRGEDVGRPRAEPATRSGAAVRRTGGAGSRHRRRRRRARPPRHHRPAPGRSGPARLRGQRVARAAHAAHRHPRIRRSAARRAAGLGPRARLSRDDRPPQRTHGAAGQRPAPARAARRAAGADRTGTRATSRPPPQRCAPISAQAIAAKRQHVAIAVAPDAGEVWADPGKLHDVLRNLDRKRRELRARRAPPSRSHPSRAAGTS